MKNTTILSGFRYYFSKSHAHDWLSAFSKVELRFPILIDPPELEILMRLSVKSPGLESVLIEASKNLKSFLLCCRGVQPGLRCARCVRVRRVRVRGRVAWPTLRRAELRPTLLRARHVLQRNVPVYQRLERQALHPRG